MKSMICFLRKKQENCGEPRQTQDAMNRGLSQNGYGDNKKPIEKDKHLDIQFL